jgi:hypothetical protein
MSKLTEKTYRREYNHVLKLLHTCKPEDKDGLKQLLDYYYRRLNYEKRD